MTEKSPQHQHNHHHHHSQEENDEDSYLVDSDCDEEFIDYDNNNNNSCNDDQMDTSDDDNDDNDDNTNILEQQDTNEELREIFTNGELEYKDALINLSLHQGLPSYCLNQHPTRMDIICSGGGDDKVIIFKIKHSHPITTESFTLISELLGHTDTVEHCLFYPSPTSINNSLLATASMDGSCIIWKENDEGMWSFYQRIECIPSENGGISWISWHPKGPIIAIGCSDSTIWICNAMEPGITLTILMDQTENDPSVDCTVGKWSPDGKNILSGYSNGKVLLWGRIGEGGQIMGRITPSNKFTEQGTRVPDDQLCPPGNQRQVQTNNHDNRTIFPTSSAVRLVEFAPPLPEGNAKLATIAFEDGISCVIRLDSLSPKLPLLYSWRMAEKGVEFMKFNPHSLIMASLDSRLAYYSVSKFTTRYSGGGQMSGGGGGDISEEDNSIQGQQIIRNCKGGICCGTESPDHSLILLASRTGRLSVWDTKVLSSLSDPIMPSLTKKGESVGGDVESFLDEMENPCYSVIILEKNESSLIFLASWEDGFTRMCKVLLKI